MSLPIERPLRTHRHLQKHPENWLITMLVSLTVGKVDAGVAVLLTEDKRLVRTSTAPAHLKLADRITDRVPFYPTTPRYFIRKYC